MKKMNLLVMSLVSAAALSFTSCSSNDDLAGNAGQEKVDGFYMTLTVQSPNASGTRTVQSNEYNASEAESKITSGKFFLMDSKNKIVFHKEFTNLEWDKTGKTQLEIPVENVIAGAEYKVYFLANTDSDDPLNSTFSTKATTDNKFVGDYAKADNFAMFNENDKDVKGNSYTVTFKDENKSKTNAAKVNKTIKLERITARIDQPTSNETSIKPYPTDENHKATEAEKKAMADAIAKVDKIELTRYAISNVANTTNIMQKWNDTQLLIPSSATGFKYIQPTDEFGSKTLFLNAKYFNPIVKDENGKVKDEHKDYVFENNNDNAATSMYFEYKVTLKAEAGDHKDFPDGTFYRYKNIIYTSFTDIKEAFKDVNDLFENKTAEDLKKEVEDAKKATDSETELDKLRREYDIEIFNEGKTYYKMAIKDKFIGYDNAIQRNTVYQLNVKNIFNVGAQVPNGTPDKTGLFYLDVEVSVNPWVLNSYDVDLQ
ncbi:Mfa1 family fimbria major subunit [Segatella copri]|uniref:Mfa1 family fimbria major subunit n=1 Tax=Segatella copri TaxID=165179 RepID=UPI00294AF1E5|nr:Mfa1 family fimbria major subunit [Segatella copri]WOG04428.1 Mfa1 family fimbria major subunit [Segatella copri]